METSLIAAIVTSISTSASTAGVAIVALTLNNKRFDSIERKIDQSVDRLETKIDKLEVSIDMLNGTTKELDKRLSIIEDRMFHRP